MTDKTEKLAIPEVEHELTRFITAEFREEFEKRIQIQRERGTPESQLTERALTQWLCIKPDMLEEIYLNAESKFPGGFRGLVQLLGQSGGGDNLLSLSNVIVHLVNDSFPTEKIETYIKAASMLAEQKDSDVTEIYLKSDALSPTLLSILEEDEQTFLKYINEAFTGSYEGPNGEMIPALFDYQLQGYGSEDFEETLAMGKEIVKRYAEHEPGMERMNARPNLDSVLYWFFYLDKYSYSGFAKSPNEKSSNHRDLVTYRKEYLESIFGRRAQPHLLASTFVELVETGLKPELARKLLHGPLATYLDNAYDRDGRSFSPFFWNEEGVVRFDEVEEIGPEFEEAIMAMTESDELEYLLRKDEKETKLELVEDEFSKYETRVVREHDMEELMNKAKALLMRLGHYKESPAHNKHCDFESTIEELQSSLTTAIFRRELRFYINAGKSSFEEAPLLREANETTRYIITGTALLMAMGAMGKTEASQLRLPAGPQNESLGRLAENDSNPSYMKELITRMNTFLPQVDQFIRQQRLAIPGLMPIGTKIHLQEAGSFEINEALRCIPGMNSTPFKLIHAERSVLLPPLPSAAEEWLLLIFLEKMGMIDKKESQLQTAMAGRFSDETAGMAGSAMLLGTRKGTRYKKGAFATTHDKATGARIMAYDAGVKMEGLPFDIPSATGRTDMLGRQSTSDIYLYQLLGTIASHQEFGGLFEAEAEQFRADYSKLLHKHDLSQAIVSSAWVFDTKRQGDSLSKHEAMVDQFTAKWFEGFRQGPKKGFGIIGEVRKLIQKTSRNMKERSEEIALQRPEDYERLKKY